MKTIADFCGPIPYAILEDDAGANTTKRDPSFMDFLRFVAIRRSMHAAKEYTDLSRIVVPEEQKSFFSEMASLKRNEYTCIQRYHSGDRIILSESKNQLSRALCDGCPEIRSFATLEDAFRFAMNKELKHYCKYLKLAELEEEIETKLLFLFLVRKLQCCLNYVQNRLQLFLSLQGGRDGIAIAS